MSGTPAPEKVAALAALEQAMGTLRNEAWTVLTGLRAAGYDVARIEEGERPNYEEMRKERGWPTPNHMRRTADALDTLTVARYGDVLRWVADLCDAALAASDEAAPESRHDEAGR